MYLLSNLITNSITDKRQSNQIGLSLICHTICYQIESFHGNWPFEYIWGEIQTEPYMYHIISVIDFD